MHKLVCACLLATLIAGPVHAENRIDTIRPDAPELAEFGSHAVGVRTMTFTDPGRVDVKNASAERPLPIYDRSLTVEVWYPAADGTEPGSTYNNLARDGLTPVALHGIAARDAKPAEGMFPLVVISHGYPGDRFLMSHLGENLASKGYVTASIRHPDSTYDDKTLFASTLVNRPLDQAFVIDSLTELDDDIAKRFCFDSKGLLEDLVCCFSCLSDACLCLCPFWLNRVEVWTIWREEF